LNNKEKIPIIYKKITIKDIPAANISTYFQESANYIDKVLKTGESNILIHCKAGVSRSASIVIAYLMIKRGLRLSQALKLV
jgi:protein-tyrosine phosphatase